MSDESIYVQRLRAVRKVVKGVPGDLLNMEKYGPGVGLVCGCALHHYVRSGANEPREFWDEYFGITEEQEEFLFSTMGKRTYATPTGQPAKDEFLRRIDAVIAEKLQAA